MSFGGEFVAETKHTQSQITSTVQKEFDQAVEKVDNNLSILVGSMQVEVSPRRSFKDRTNCGNS